MFLDLLYFHDVKTNIYEYDNIYPLEINERFDLDLISNVLNMIVNGKIKNHEFAAWLDLYNHVLLDPEVIRTKRKSSNN